MDDLGAHHRLAEVVETGLVVQAPHETFESVPERVVTEVVEAGLVACLAEEVVELRHGPPTERSATLRRNSRQYPFVPCRGRQRLSTVGFASWDPGR